jgi:5-methylcytosine-specific restriction endonuclease McrA
MPKGESVKAKKARSLNSYIFAGLGKVWMWWPERLAVKKRCKVEGKTGWYRCELCRGEVERLDVDHIIPVVPVSGFTTWDHYIASRFVTADKLQGICRECHAKKTKEENRQRRLNAKAR